MFVISSFLYPIGLYIITFVLINIIFLTMKLNFVYVKNNVSKEIEIEYVMNGRAISYTLLHTKIVATF
jgi:hypothetical protein